MKLFKSIKWRLQLWYGLILVLVLAGFGFTAYQLEQGRQMHRVDEELHRRFAILANALHRPPPHETDAESFNRPPLNQFPDNNLPNRERALQKFVLTPQAAALFGTDFANNFYFIIEDRGGRQIAHSDNLEQIFTKNTFVEPIPVNAPPDIGPAGVDSAPRHELNETLPSGETIRVGCSIKPELKELHKIALKLTGIGAVILFFGLAGGWWISSRAIRPISQISFAATKIAAGDLAQRIPVAETESELGQLAAVLNSTFARLEAAFAQQKQFASDAAHELRTPVSVILTQTQTALKRERAAADYKQTIEACQRASQRMKKLISSLLELARLDAGQEPMKHQRFDFSKTIASCVEEICPLANERGVKIISELAPLEISGDAERLAQVVTNLLTNAIQYNHDGGEARVHLKSENGLAVLTVSDTGAGIAAEDLPRVFERFYRADFSRSSGNAGLGLAISKAIVEAHGGTMEVASEENVGTTFIVRLPG